MSESDSGLTADRLLGGRVSLRQPAEGYRAAIDPILLAAAATDGDRRVLDIGCGVGTAAICLATRITECSVTGLEIQPDLAALARENAAENGLSGRVEIVTGDLLDPPDSVAAIAFDAVIANPPYQTAGQSAPPDASKAIANHEGEAALADWVRFGVRVLKHKGRLTMIHRADRLDGLCAALHPTFGDIRLLPLWPRAGAAARRVIVQARKGVRSPASLLPGLVLHEGDGRFTAAAEAILRDGAALPL